MNKITLNNRTFATPGKLYYPRLQVNKHGEIVLALEKQGCLTRGILVAKTPTSTSVIPIGKVWADWEVAGELEDYDGAVTVVLKNEHPAQ